MSTLFWIPDSGFLVQCVGYTVFDVDGKYRRFSCQWLQAPTANHFLILRDSIYDVISPLYKSLSLQWYIVVLWSFFFYFPSNFFFGNLLSVYDKRWQWYLLMTLNSARIMYLWLVRVKAYKTVWQSFYSDQSQTPHFRDRHAQPLTLKSRSVYS